MERTSIGEILNRNLTKRTKKQLVSDIHVLYDIINHKEHEIYGLKSKIEVHDKYYAIAQEYFKSK